MNQLKSLDLDMKIAKFNNNRKVIRAKKKTRKWIWAIIRSIFLIGFSFIILYPVITMISKGFMHQSDVYDNTVLWIPKHWTLDNIGFAMKVMDYWSAFGKSLIITVATTICQTLSCMIVGYGFARYNFKFKNLLFLLVVFTIIVPQQTIMAPLYLHFKDFDIFGIFTLLRGKPLSLINSPVPFILLSLTGQGLRNGLFIFLFRQSFRSMPKETEEAAMVDGAGPFLTFARVMAPSATNIIATIILFSFVWEWNDTFYTNIFLQNWPVLPIAYNTLESQITFGASGTAAQIISQYGQYNFKDGKITRLVCNAAILVIMVPLLIMYMFTQRFFVESIERSGLVG